MTILNINKFHFLEGGAERFYFELQKLLEQNGHTVIPFAMKHKNNFPSSYQKYFISEIQTKNVDRLSILYHPWQSMQTISRYFWSFEAIRKLKRLIHKCEKPQIAIIHNIYHQISPSILPLLKKYNIKIILIAHDYGLLSPNYNMFVKGKIYDKICGKNWLTCIKDKCIKKSFLVSLVCSLETWFHHSVLNVYKNNIDLVIAPSKFMKKMFIKGGWPEQKIVLLPYFVHPSTPLRAGKNTPRLRSGQARTPLDSAQGRQEHKNKITKYKDNNYILYFGRLSEEKGIDVLIKAMKNLPDIELKIVGTGPEEKNYRLQNIKVLGYKSGNELSPLITNARFIVMPSIWYENYPLSILEAYFIGVPALVSNIGGLPEIIPDNDKNFLFEPNNVNELTQKIKFLWNNQKVLDIASEKVKKFVKENNDPERYYRKLMEIYKKLTFE